MACPEQSETSSNLLLAGAVSGAPADRAASGILPAAGARRDDTGDLMARTRDEVRQEQREQREREHRQKQPTIADAEAKRRQSEREGKPFPVPAPLANGGPKANGADAEAIFIRTGDQFRREYEPLKYAIDDLLVQGQVTAITAPTSHGKTTLALCMGGHQAEQPGEVQPARTRPRATSSMR